MEGLAQLQVPVLCSVVALGNICLKTFFQALGKTTPHLNNEPRSVPFWGEVLSVFFTPQGWAFLVPQPIKSIIFSIILCSILLCGTFFFPVLNLLKPFFCFCFLFLYLCLEWREFLDYKWTDSSSPRRHIHKFSRSKWVCIRVHFPLTIWGF